MALCNMKSLLADANASGIAVGAFNVGNMEMLIAVIKAAEPHPSYFGLNEAMIEGFYNMKA